MLDEFTVLDRFEEGSADHDPALIWSVDLRCNGSGLPVDADGACRWLLEQRGDHPRRIRAVRRRVAGWRRHRSLSLAMGRFPKASRGRADEDRLPAMRRAGCTRLALVLRMSRPIGGRGSRSSLRPVRSPSERDMTCQIDAAEPGPGYEHPDPSLAPLAGWPARA